MKTQTNELTGNCCGDDTSPETSAGTTSLLLQRILHFIKECRQQYLDRLMHKSILTLDDKSLKDIGVHKDEIRLGGNLTLSSSVTTDLEILTKRPNHTQ